MTIPSNADSGHVTGLRLRLAREYAGIKPKEAAGWHGITTHRLAKIEAEGRYLFEEALTPLAHYYRCRPDWLLGTMAPGTEDLWLRVRLDAAHGGLDTAALEADLLHLDPPDARLEEAEPAKAKGKKTKA